MNLKNLILTLLLFSSSVIANEIININLANHEQLKTLSGIGKAKADAIIQWREKHGPFTSVTNLTEVPGIGPGLLQRNIDRLIIQIDEIPATSNTDQTNADKDTNTTAE